MKLERLIVALCILMLGCSSQKDRQSFVGTWKLFSVESNLQNKNNEQSEELTFLNIDYTKMDGYIFIFKKDGVFEQNYYELVDVEPNFKWEVNDSLLTTYFMINNEKQIFIKGQFSFISYDQFLLKTNNQTITFKRVKEF